MTEPAPEATPYPWLDPAQVRRWLQVDEGTAQADVVEDLRRSAADYCEDQRRDLFVDVLAADGVTVVPTFTPSPRHVQAGVLATARLYARRSSPAGLASFGEFGAAEVLRLDPDVSRLLGTGRFAPPAVG